MPEIPAPANEDGFSLVFQKAKRQWFIHLWSNQVVTATIASAPPLAFAKERSYKFVLPTGVKLEKQGFYKHGVASEVQRKRAVAAYTRAIRAKLAEGYTLAADSRVLAASARKKPVRTLAPAKVKALKGWAALKHWGTRYANEHDPRLDAAADVFAKATEAEIKFAALKKLRPRGDGVRIDGDVTDGAFAGSFLWVTGDLHVAGNLELGVDLYVSGDLVVDGIIRDTREWTHLLVGGSVKARALVVGSQLYCRGSAEAAVVLVDGTGELAVGKRLVTKLLVEQGYDHAITAAGKIVAAHRARFSEETGAGVAVLENVLSRALATPVRQAFAAKGDDTYFDKRPLVAALRANKRIWK